MKKVILTEKKSVAIDIAKVLGANKDVTGYIGGIGSDGNEYRITWCLGHLLEIYVEEAEGQWDISKLPILPQKILLQPIGTAAFAKTGTLEEYENEHVDKDSSSTEIPKNANHQSDGNNKYKSRLETIRRLFQWADTIIAATDAGREGQGIFQNVYAYLNIKKPVERLWIQSLTDEAIREGLKNLVPYDSPAMYNLARSAWQRAMSDWLVGVNLTRAFTLASNYRDYSGKKKVMSLGRVQTPTLCMICERAFEHDNFKPQPFWYLEGRSMKNGVEFSVHGDVRFMKQEVASRIYADIMIEKKFVVTGVKTERKTESPPLLHDIASLQKLANTRYGYTLEETVDTVEDLYLKHLVTYPRTGSRYITEDVFKTVPALFRTISHNREYGDIVRSMLASDKYSTRSVNNAKVTDHHALIITGGTPGELTEKEKNVYDLILSRFVEAFAAPCIADITVVHLNSCDADFIIRSRKEILSGWRAVSKNKTVSQTDVVNPDEKEFDTGEIPLLKEGEYLPVTDLEIVHDVTKPQPYLTDATLLTQMENAGRRIEDKAMSSILKDVGIGTPATRHEVLSTLERRAFIVRKDKTLKPTKIGMDVWRTVKDLEIADVAMTAHWETSLKKIEDGIEDPKIFDSNIRRYVYRVTNELLTSDAINSLRNTIALEHPMLNCPSCGEDIRLGDKVAWCGKCGFRLYRNFRGQRLTDSVMKKLLTEKMAGPVTFTSKEGKEYRGMLSMDHDGKIDLTFTK